MVDANTPSLGADEDAVAPSEPTLASLIPDAGSLAALPDQGVAEPLDATVQHALLDQQVATAVLPLPADAGPDATDSAPPDAPAASLLLPYFEVDLDDPSSPSSLFDVNTPTDPNPPPVLEQPPDPDDQGAGVDPTEALPPDAPAASLLLPYFEVDLDDPSSPSSLFDVNTPTDPNPPPMPPGPSDALDADHGSGGDDVQRFETYQEPGYDDGVWDSDDGAPLVSEGEMASDAGGDDPGAEHLTDDGPDAF